MFVNNIIEILNVFLLSKRNSFEYSRNYLNKCVNTNKDKNFKNYDVTIPKLIIAHILFTLTLVFLSKFLGFYVLLFSIVYILYFLYSLENYRTLYYTASISQIVLNICYNTCIYYWKHINVYVSFEGINFLEIFTYFLN